MTLTALLQDPSARENCLTHKPSSVLIGDQAGLKISSSSKSCFGHMAAAASAAATTGRPAAEAAADDPNSQPAFNGWRPKPLHENADMLLHRLLSRHWELELRAASRRITASMATTAHASCHKKEAQKNSYDWGSTESNSYTISESDTAPFTSTFGFDETS